MQPSIGRIVIYTLTEEDAQQINRRRTTGKEIADRIKHNSLTAGEITLEKIFPAMWPLGAQAHIGNAVSVGDQYPCIVVRVWLDEFGVGVPGINGQVILDGNDQFWVMSKSESPSSSTGQWHWPPRM